MRGAPLVEAEGWLAERRGELSEAEREFIQAGVTLRERQSPSARLSGSVSWRRRTSLPRSGPGLPAGCAGGPLGSAWH